MMRRYANFVAGTFLTGAIDDSQTNLPVNSTASFDGIPFPFILAIANDGLGGGELVLCTAVPDASNLTVERGYDGTDPAAASENDLVEHTTGAIDYREAGIVRITEAERDALADEDLWDGRVIYNEDTDALNINRAAGGWDAIAVLPVGAMIPFTALTLPQGFLWADGSEVSRATYPALNALYALDSYPFGDGDESTTFNLPNMEQRFPLGLTDAGVGSTIGETGGLIDHVHTGPSHTHGPGDLTVDSQGGHTHTNPTTSTDAHTHTNPTTSTDNHSHTNPSTSNTGAHTHAFSSATTSSDSHSHSFSDNFTTGGPSGNNLVGAGGAEAAAALGHTHSGSVSGSTSSDNHAHTLTVNATSSQGAHSHTVGATSVDGHSHTQGATGSDAHSHTQGATGSSGAHTHTATGGLTGAEGTANTGGANPPFLTVPWIVRY